MEAILRKRIILKTKRDNLDLVTGQFIFIIVVYLERTISISTMKIKAKTKMLGEKSLRL